MTSLVAGATVALVVVSLLGTTQPARLPRQVQELPSLLGAFRLLPAAGDLLDRFRPARPRARRDAQLPDALDRLASCLRGGRAVGPAIVSVADQLADPLRSELATVALAVTHGEPVSTALSTWAALPGSSRDVQLSAAALSLGADAGGEVARAVDRIAATLRERRELRGEVHALATQARASAGVLAVAPLAFAGLVAGIEPGAVAFLITTPVGLACLACGLLLEAIGAAWMARITRTAA